LFVLLRQPCGPDVSGRIHIPVVVRLAMRAGPRTRRQRQGFERVTAGVAALAGRQPSVNWRIPCIHSGCVIIKLYVTRCVQFNRC
jgi:hypothetical protein